MKIAFIYSYVMGEVWSTPLSLAKEFQSRGWEVEIFSLLSDQNNYTDAGIKMMLDQIDSKIYAPDIIFYLDWGRFDSVLLDKDLYKKAFWIQEAGDEPQNFDKNYLKSDRFNLVLSPDHTSTLKYKEAGRNALWFTHFADTEIYKPKAVNVKYDVVCTRGYGTSAILDRLKHDLGDSFYNKHETLGESHADALQRGKMVVQHARHGEVTRRIFEAMACGKMVLTDRLSEETLLQDLFKDRKEIIFYDNYDDLRDKINYYLYNTTEREKIAIAGREAVLKSHTQVKRVDTILKEFRRWKNFQ